MNKVADEMVAEPKSDVPGQLNHITFSDDN